MWVGWLLFNGASSLGMGAGSKGAAERAVMNTFLAPGASGVFAFFFKRFFIKSDIKWDPATLPNGILAGLVGVTAGCDALEGYGAIIVGITSGIVYCLACAALEQLKIDDPLEAF